MPAVQVADDHFHKWRDDIELMQQLGLKHYRYRCWGHTQTHITPTAASENNCALLAPVSCMPHPDKQAAPLVLVTRSVMRPHTLTSSLCV